MKLIIALEAARDIRGLQPKRALSAGELHGSAPMISRSMSFARLISSSIAARIDAAAAFSPLNWPTIY
jgi:hypothetical protein